MNIRGYFNADGSPYLDIIVLTSNGGHPRRISFLIDTGTPRTVISERDVAKLGIDFSQMEKMNADMLGIGGFTQIFKLNNLTFSFTTEDGEHQEDIHEVLVNKHDQLPDKYKKQIPSLLGRDVTGAYALVVNGRKDLVLLSDEWPLRDTQ